LPLEKKIILFKKFERFLGGGCVFRISRPADTNEQIKFLRILLHSDLNAFRFSA